MEVAEEERTDYLVASRETPPDSWILLAALHRQVFAGDMELHVAVNDMLLDARLSPLEVTALPNPHDRNEWLLYVARRDPRLYQQLGQAVRWALRFKVGVVDVHGYDTQGERVRVPMDKAPWQDEAAPRVLGYTTALAQLPPSELAVLPFDTLAAHKPLPAWKKDRVLLATVSRRAHTSIADFDALARRVHHECRQRRVRDKEDYCIELRGTTDWDLLAAHRDPVLFGQLGHALLAALHAAWDTVAVTTHRRDGGAETAHEWTTAPWQMLPECDKAGLDDDDNVPSAHILLAELWSMGTVLAGDEARNAAHAECVLRLAPRDFAWRLSPATVHVWQLFVRARDPDLYAHLGQAVYRALRFREGSVRLATIRRNGYKDAAPLVLEDPPWQQPDDCHVLGWDATQEAPSVPAGTEDEAGLSRRLLREDLMREFGIKEPMPSDSTRGDASFQCRRCWIRDAAWIALPCECLTLCGPCQATYTPTAYGHVCPRCLSAVVQYKRLDDDY
jgi:hypothetical protein